MLFGLLWKGLSLLQCIWQNFPRLFRGSDSECEQKAVTLGWNHNYWDTTQVPNCMTNDSADVQVVSSGMPKVSGFSYVLSADMYEDLEGNPIK